MTGPGGRLGGIVLAGGRSSRFGRDKLAEPVDGRPLLHHAIGAVQRLGPDVEVVVVAAPGVDPALPAGVRLAHDDEPFGGPLAGLAAGLTALGPDIERVLVVAGDMTTVVPAVLAVLDETVRDGADAAVLEDPTGARPFVFPIAFRRSPAAPVVEALLAGGTRRFGAVAEALVAQVVPAQVWLALDPSASTPRDIDVPGDLSQG